jgi:hypothetical protein
MLFYQLSIFICFRSQTSKSNFLAIKFGSILGKNQVQSKNAEGEK